MAKLIQLRQRMRAIKTIQKLTHAMRLIAMSSHSYLRSLQKPMNGYLHDFTALFTQLLAAAPNWHNQLIYPPPPTNHSKIMMIIIGSQKGLCGSFNTNLFRLIQNRIAKKKYPAKQLKIIAIGQKAVDFSRNLKTYEIKHSYEKNNVHRISSITQEITHALIHESPPYHSIVIASNTFKSFFSQQPQITQLTPLEFEKGSATQDHTDYIWEQTPQEILTDTVPQYISAHLYYYLYQSLLSEHAARFISMDSATRNAESLLEETKLEYNKLRQAKITKELAELSGSYS